MSTQPQSRVNVVGPDGLSYSVPAEELPLAIERGARLESPEETARKVAMRNAQTASPLPTIASAAFETIPFVGGDAALAIDKLTHNTLVDAEAEKAMKPGAGALGTAIGTGVQVGALAGVGGVEGLASKAGVFGEAGIQGLGLGTRTAARTIAGAAEGGFFGAGSAVNDAVLNDHPLTAEYLLANAAGGALFGGALAGGLSIAGEGFERAAQHYQKIGTAARNTEAAGLVGRDLKALEDAGLSPRMIDQAYKDGILRTGMTSPLEVQTAVAQRLVESEQAIANIGAKLEASQQTVNLLGLVKSAAKKAGSGGDEGIAELIKSGALTADDELAPISRVLAFRKGLQADATTAGMVRKVDDTLADLAYRIEPKFGVEAAETLSKQRDYLMPLARVADDAVARGVVPAGASGADSIFGALSRQGDHLGAIGALASMAMGVNPAASFIAMGAGNILRRVAGNPGAIGETIIEGMQAITKATALTHDDLARAVQTAVLSKATPKIPVGDFGGKLLKQNATDMEVQALRAELANAEGNNLANGHPAIAQALATQRAILAAALPNPSANIDTPRALARPQIGPTGKQIERYNSTYVALARPLDVIARVGRGNATDTEIRTVAMAYPLLATRAGQMMLDTAAKQKKPVRLSVKRAIEILRGTSLDPATTPAKIARIQAIAYSEPNAPGRGGAAPGNEGVKLNQKGMAQMDMGDRISAGMMSAADEARKRK